MLAYRHAFHAGNHADVLKHFVTIQLLQYLNQNRFDDAFRKFDSVITMYPMAAASLQDSANDFPAKVSLHMA